MKMLRLLLRDSDGSSAGVWPWGVQDQCPLGHSAGVCALPPALYRGVLPLQMAGSPECVPLCPFPIGTIAQGCLLEAPDPPLRVT